MEELEKPCPPTTISLPDGAISTSLMVLTAVAGMFANVLFVVRLPWSLVEYVASCGGPLNSLVSLLTDSTTTAT